MLPKGICFSSFWFTTNSVTRFVCIYQFVFVLKGENDPLLVVFCHLIFTFKCFDLFSDSMKGMFALPQLTSYWKFIIEVNN